MQDLPPTKQISAEETQYQRSMQKLFDQINFNLQQLFRNLSYIYKTHGILYNLSNFHGFLLRMMLPPELLSFIHFWCPNGKFRDKALALLESSRSSLEQFSTRKQNINTQEAVKSEQMESKSQDSNIIQSQKPIIEQEQNIEKQQQNKIDEQQVYREICDPVSQGEVRLYEWVIEQAKKGNRLSRLDLIKQAISTGQVSHLSGSSRWCKKFLSRNPQLRKYVKKQPEGKQQGKKQKISQLISEIFKRKQNQQFEQVVPSSVAKHQAQQHLYFDAQPSIQPEMEQWKGQAYKKEEPTKRQNKYEQIQNMNEELNQNNEKQQLLCQLIDEQERARYERHVRKVAIEKSNSNIVIERNYENDQYLEKLRKNIFELYHNPTIPLADKVNGILQSKMKIIEDEILEEEENLAESDWVDELQNKKYFEREQPDNKEEESEEDVDRIYVENKYLDKMRNSDK